MATKKPTVRSPAQIAATRKAHAIRTTCMMQSQLSALEGYVSAPMLGRLRTVLQTVESQVRTTPAN